MNLFVKFGLLLAISILITGCHTIVLVDENDAEDEVLVEEEISEPAPAAQFIMNFIPLLIQEIVISMDSSYSRH